MPSWAVVDPAQVANGLWWIVVALLAAIGGRAGFKGTAKGQEPPQQPTVQMAGAVIDAKLFQDLLDQLGFNTVALTAKGKALERNSAAVEAHAAAVERAMKQTEDAADHMERLAREMRDLRDETKSLRDEMLRRSRRD